ncbi:tetratricopeptide repeat protein [Posidoniimonas polymericola]|uniref:Tetratricopeptide repeat protein n=1 Tax=Posidoniimonas polymericola TaxID=2528002 RepID=A0A5C5ZDY8_9BACT|nr:tetratricopeptide repeat protein [Posidoniimonas polymericola]TWT85378.1 tetratricopeptide repeat protein [Posidoniimonas polymericola]
MQRYQVNYKLLVGLVVGAVAVGGALYGLLLVQSYRGAEKLLTMAEEDRKAGDLHSAAMNLYRFTQKREHDEEHAIEMAMTFAEIAEAEDSEMDDKRQALGIMEATTRKWRKNTELRRRLVDLMMKFGLTKDASEHLQILINDNPKDPELLAMLGTCYLRMNQNEKALRHCAGALGYDPERNKFDDEKAVAPDEIDLYGLLATALSRTNADPAKAESVMDHAVDANPESGDAYVARARLRLSKGDDGKEAGIADLEKALEVDEKNLDALLLRARIYAQDEEYGKAKELLNRGLAESPDSGSLYLTGAYVAAREDGAEAALDWYERGVKETTGGEQISLQVSQARALINAKKLGEARKLINQLAKIPNLQKIMLDYLRARLMVSEENWYQAADQLSTLRPLLQGNSEISEELNGMLALCYTRLEMWEKVIDAAGSVLQINPQSQIAIDLKANAERKIGRSPSTTAGGGGGGSINDRVAEQMRLPEDERNWDGVLTAADQYADEKIEEGLMTPAAKKLLLSEIHMRSQDYKKATSLIKAAINEEPDNINTWRLACRLTASDPEGGAVQALKMLDAVEKRFADRFDDERNLEALLRLDRADMYMQINDEQTVERMLAVTDGIESWPKRQQQMVWQGLITRFEALRAAEALDKARTKVAELAPGELSNLLDMFVAARADNDDARMTDIQNKILEVVGDKNDANWLYTEANRKISLVQRGLEDGSTLKEAEQLAEKARQQRPEWHLPYLLLADLALARNDAAEALNNLDEAADYGQPTARSLLQHVSLLMQSGRFDDALKQLDRATPAFRERLLGRQFAEALLNARYLGIKDRWEESVDAAQNVAEQNPDSGDVQLWLGRFMLKASMSDRLKESTRERAAAAADVAFRKAVELTPKSEEAWLAFLGYLSTTGDEEASAEAVRQLQLELTEDTAPLVLAAGYELQKRWFDAENVYKRALESDPDNRLVISRLARFYLGNGYPRADKLQKATPLMNRLIKAGEEDPQLATTSEVMWAHRTAAKILAQAGDYQKALDAERLLRSNVVNGRLSNEDTLTMAKILASRPEPGSRLKAIKLYESVQGVQDLEPGDKLNLGQLYFATNDWEKAQRTMVELTSRNRDFVAAREAFIRMLLAKDGPGDLKTAANQLKNLQRVAPTDTRTLELLVRISSKMGRKQDVIPVLRGLLQRPENRRDVSVILRVAKLLAELDDVDNAEKLYQAAANMAPRTKVEYADFIGKHRSLDEALDMLDTVDDDDDDVAFLIVQRGTGLLKYAGEGATDEHFDRVQSRLERMLREDPESVRLLMQKAELLDIHRDYDGSSSVYLKLLAREDLKKFERAVVLNNLAYQLAMTTSDKNTMEEAMGYVAEAADILGPRSDILDTRAVVHMAMGQAEEAVADMDLAVTEGATASKYYHKARAHLLAGQTQQAVSAWDKAVDMDLDPNELGLVERDAYEKAKQQIERLKSSGTSQQPAA